MILKKIYKAGIGLILLLLKVRKYDTSIYNGKRVAIIGPANTSENSGKGSYIDGFDIVIRINKSAFLVDSGKFKNDIGSRLDILFHCFYENDFSGGGKLDLKLYDKLNVKYIVNPRSTFEGYRTVFNFYKKYLKPKTVYVLPKSLHDKLHNDLDQYRSTTGFAAIYSVLMSDFTELYIQGFTFFKTAYVDGYRDALKSASKVQGHIKQAKLHDPDLEYEVFKKLLEENRSKKVHFDNALTEILKSDSDKN